MLSSRCCHGDILLSSSSMRLTVRCLLFQLLPQLDSRSVSSSESASVSSRRRLLKSLSAEIGDTVLFRLEPSPGDALAVGTGSGRFLNLKDGSFGKDARSPSAMECVRSKGLVPRTEVPVLDGWPTVAIATV